MRFRTAWLNRIAPLVITLSLAAHPLRGQEPAAVVPPAVTQAAAAEAPATPLEFPLTLPGADAGKNAKPKFEHDRSSRVLILGYHRFSKKKADSLSVTDKELRQQLRDVDAAGFEFIPMADFLAWRRGEANIPPLSAVVTIDDGFRSIADIADPIFKEFAVPYTVFAYTSYLGNGGQALSWEQLRKLAESGVDVASHSASHHHMSGVKSPLAGKASAQPHLDWYKFPRAHGSDLKKPRDLLARLSLGLGSPLGGAVPLAGAARWSQVGMARDPYEAWVWDETYGSRARFEKDLGEAPATFSYPYGVYSDRVAEMVMDAGYEAAFTVNGEEVNILTPKDRIHRFIVQSDKPELFDAALKFRVVGATPQGDPAEMTPGVTVSPGKHQMAAGRTPEITAYLRPWLASGMEADPATFSLRLSGFADAPFTYDPATGLLSASVPTTLRGRSHTAIITGTSISGEKLSLRWSFLLPPPAKSALAQAQ